MEGMNAEDGEMPSKGIRTARTLFNMVRPAHGDSPALPAMIAGRDMINPAIMVVATAIIRMAAVKTAAIGTAAGRPIDR